MQNITGKSVICKTRCLLVPNIVTGLRKTFLKLYLWTSGLYGYETWTVGGLEAFEMYKQFWRRQKMMDEGVIETLLDDNYTRLEYKQYTERNCNLLNCLATE